MAQTYKYTIVGDTQPAVKGNEALNTSIKQVDASTQQLESNLAKSGEALELNLQKQEAKIKAIGGAINVLGGSVELAVGSLGLIGIDQEIVSQFQKAAVSAIAFADGAKRVFEGYKEITEAKKLFATVTKAETAAEAVNTTTTTANTAATATNTAATVTNTAATNTANTAQKALNTTLLANPYIATAAAVAALTAGIYLLIQAQDEEGKAAERAKKRREEQNKLYDAQLAADKAITDNLIKAAELGKEEALANELRIAQAERLFQTQKRVSGNAIKDLEEQIKLLDEQLTLTQETLKANNISAKSRQAFIDLQEKQYLQLIALQDKVNEENAKIEAARLAIDEERVRQEEERQAKLKKAAEDKAKRDEDLARRAVKQLEDQRQATEDLIDLYVSLYPEKVTSGQFEFNTELDRTNFALQQQLDVLTSLNTKYEDLGDQLEEIDFNESVSFFSEEQLAVFKKLRDANKTQLQLQLDDLDATYRADLSLFSDNEEMKSKITAQYEEDRAKLRRQFAIQTAQDIIGVTSNFVNILAEINQQSLELQLAQAAGNQAAIDKINQDALEKQKKLRIAQTLITTAESILNGFNATSTLPPPFNFIAGGILALAYGALGTKTIAAINATTLEGGGASSGGFNNIPSSGFSLPSGGQSVPITQGGGAALPGLGGGRLAGAPTIGTVGQEPIRAYVLAGDVTNGVQANVALNNRRRLAGG